MKYIKGVLAVIVLIIAIPFIIIALPALGLLSLAQLLVKQ